MDLLCGSFAHSNWILMNFEDYFSKNSPIELIYMCSGLAATNIWSSIKKGWKLNWCSKITQNGNIYIHIYMCSFVLCAYVLGKKVRNLIQFNVFFITFIVEALKLMKNVQKGKKKLDE